MTATVAERLRHIKDGISSIRALLDGRTKEELVGLPHVRAALERYLEIISEASRHIPADWKNGCGANVPWWEVAAFGNIVRHAYDQVDVAVLWSVYANDLDLLESAIDAMLAVRGPQGDGR
jgi:uncharacterized protein with HEPN domain